MKLSSARRCGETCSGRVPVSPGLRHMLPHPLRRSAGRLHRPGRVQRSEPERRAHVAQVAGCFQVRHRRACPRRPAPPVNRSPPAQLPACPPARGPRSPARPRPAAACAAGSPGAPAPPPALPAPPRPRRAPRRRRRPAAAPRPSTSRRRHRPPARPPARSPLATPGRRCSRARHRPEPQQRAHRLGRQKCRSRPPLLSAARPAPNPGGGALRGRGHRGRGGAEAGRCPMEEGLGRVGRTLGGAEPGRGGTKGWCSVITLRNRMRETMKEAIGANGR